MGDPSSVGQRVKGRANSDFSRAPGQRLAADIKNKGQKRARAYEESGGKQPAQAGYREAVQALSLPSSFASDVAKKGPGFPVINKKVPAMKDVFPGSQPFAALTAEFSRPHPLKGMELITQVYCTRKSDYQSFGVQTPADLENLLTKELPIFVVKTDYKDQDQNGDVLKFWNIGMVNREMKVNVARFQTIEQASKKFKYIGYLMDIRIAVDKAQPDVFLVTIISGGYHKVADIWGGSEPMKPLRGHRNSLALVRRNKGFEKRQALTMENAAKAAEIEAEIEAIADDDHNKRPMAYWVFEPFVYCSEDPPSHLYCSALWDGMLVSVGIDTDSVPTGVRSQMDHSDKLFSYGIEDSAEKRAQLAKTCKKVTLALCGVVNR